MDPVNGDFSGKKWCFFKYSTDYLSISGGRDASYEEFLSDIMASGPEDCRYGLYDFEYEHQCQGTSEKTRKEKLLLMSWCPDTARIKKKMLYSSSFDALKKCLVGVQKYIQVRTKTSGNAVESQSQDTELKQQPCV